MTATEAARARYADASRPVREAYRNARMAAVAQRDGTVDAALSSYFEAIGRRDSASALTQYRKALLTATATRRLALSATRESYRTDTADEREQLSLALASAQSESQRARAWRRFEAATQDEREELDGLVKAAGATHRSMVSKAAGQFGKRAGLTVGQLARLAQRS